MTRQLSHIWFIALKDLKLFATDRGAVFFFILFPFFFVALFTFLNPAGAAEDPRLELHVVTQEAEGGLSQEIIAAMETKDDQQLQPGEPRIVWDKDCDEARQAVEDKELDGFLAFPADFSEAVFMGYGTQLEVVADAEAINTRVALNGLAKAIASQVGSQQVTAKAAIGLLVEQALATSGNLSGIEQAIMQLFSGQVGTATGESFIEFATEEVGAVEATNAADYAIPGYLVMFVFFAAALSAEAIVRERQNRTLERLLASSVRREAILGGMFTGTAAKGLIQVLTLWVVGILVFSVDVGQSPTAVILLSILTVIMSSAFGIMLATLVKTQRSAGSIAVLASLVLAPLGGCWWPLFVLPKWMQFIAMMTPHGWATTGFNKLMLFGADFSAMVSEMLALVCFAAAFGTVAVWRFRTSAA